MQVERRRGSLRTLQILLAEDSLVNQKLAVALLETHGHTVTVAGNGLDGRQRRGIAALRRGADGRADARDGWACGHDGDSRQGAGQRWSRAHRRHDGPCPQRGPRSVPGSRHGRICGKADPRRPALRGDRGRNPATSSAAASASLLPQGGGIDWSEVMRAVQDNPALLATIVEAALEEIPRLMMSIRAGRDQREFEPICVLPPIRSRDRCTALARRRPFSKRSAWNKWAVKAICAAQPRPCGCSTPRRKKSSAACPSICSQLTSSLEPTDKPGGPTGRCYARSTWS